MKMTQNRNDLLRTPPKEHQISPSGPGGYQLCLSNGERWCQERYEEQWLVVAVVGLEWCHALVNSYCHGHRFDSVQTKTPCFLVLFVVCVGDWLPTLQSLCSFPLDGERGRERERERESSEALLERSFLLIGGILGMSLL